MCDRENNSCKNLAKQSVYRVLVSKARTLMRKSNPASSNKRRKIGTMRFTLDVPHDLHRTIKVACAQRGISMTDEIQKILRIAFLNEPARNSADR